MAIDVNSPEFRADPYPFYAQLRAAGPAIWAGEQLGWLVSHDADIATLVRDPRLASQPLTAALYDGMPPEAVQAAEPFRRVMEHNLIWQDPPEHTRLRALMGLTFTPRRLDLLRSSVDAIALELLDQVRDRAEWDFMSEYAFPLPARVIMEMLGLPMENSTQLKTWSDLGVEFFGNARYTTEPVALATRVGDGFRALDTYFRDVVERRRREPGKDFVSDMIAADHQGDRLSDDEIVASCVLILAAGHETTTYALGNGLLALLQHPEELRRLRESPTLLSTAVDELMRFDSPLQFIRRVAMAPIEVGDQVIQPGQLVVLVLGSANRDPAAYEAADDLQLSRPVRPHALYFGLGPHFCLGAHLARLEMHVALARFLERFDSISLSNAPLEWNHNAIFRGLTTLPIRV